MPNYANRYGNRDHTKNDNVGSYWSVPVRYRIHILVLLLCIPRSSWVPRWISHWASRAAPCRGYRRRAPSGSCPLSCPCRRNCRRLSHGRGWPLVDTAVHTPFLGGRCCWSSKTDGWAQTGLQWEMDLLCFMEMMLHLTFTLPKPVLRIRNDFLVMIGRTGLRDIILTLQQATTYLQKKTFVKRLNTIGTGTV